MITQKDLKTAGKFIAENCEADDFVLTISIDESLDTRFAQNAITQNMTGENVMVNLKVAFGNQSGSASVNSLTEDGLAFVLENAQNIAFLSNEDPEYIASESNKEIKQTNNFSQNIADLTEENFVEIIKKCVNLAKSKEAKISGMTSKKIEEVYILTKNGFEAFDKISTFSHSMTIKKGKVETKVSKSVKDFAHFSITDEIKKLETQFNSQTDPELFEPKKIAVILRPPAVQGLMQYLFWIMDRRMSDEGVYPFTDAIGEKVFGEKFNFSSEHVENLISPVFSGQVINEDTTWVNSGVVENLHMSRFYADKINETAKRPFNMIISGEENSEQDLMNQVDEGLIINRLWYIRTTDMKAGAFTGLTRDGVLYFKNGKIQKSVNNLRWNEVITDVTKRIINLGKKEVVAHWAEVPSMLIQDFNFVDKTTF